MLCIGEMPDSEKALTNVSEAMWFSGRKLAAGALLWLLVAGCEGS
jgi:hypothetical protein